MATVSLKANQNQELGENGVKYKFIDEKIKTIIADQVRKDLHKTLDLNRSTSDSVRNHQESFAQIWPDKIKIDCSAPEPKRRCLYLNGEEKATENLGLDLNQPPQEEPLNEKSSNQSEISSASSENSCMSVMDQNPNPNPNGSTEINEDAVELSSLVVKGCSHCIMYVMVPEADPKCPQCKSSVLIDISRPNPAKRSRMD